MFSRKKSPKPRQFAAIADYAGPRKALPQRTPLALINADSFGFGLFLLVTASLFLRPGEIFPWMLGLPIYECLILGALIININPIVWLYTNNYIKQYPQVICVVGFFVSILMSYLWQAYIGGAVEEGKDFMKKVIYFSILVCSVNSTKRFRIFLLTVAMVSTAMVTLCVLDYNEVQDFSFVNHLVERDNQIDENGNAIKIITIRMRGTGIFMDPNDLSMVIVATMILCLYFLTDKTYSILKLFWLVPIAVLFIGLLNTHSRGGLLALGASLVALLASRKGEKTAITVAVMGVLALPLVSSRQTSIDLSEGTGQARIMLWKEGLMELKGPPILFGIGKEMYSDEMGLAAHNSFVHSYVELGFVGGTFFWGCFFFPLLALYRLMKSPGSIADYQMDRTRHFMAALLGGWCTSMFSLSRAYVEPTYMVIGITTVYLNLANFHLARPQCLVYWDRKHVWQLIGSSICLLSFLYVFTRLLAR